MRIFRTSHWFKLRFLNSSTTINMFSIDFLYSFFFSRTSLPQLSLCMPKAWNLSVRRFPQATALFWVQFQVCRWVGATAASWPWKGLATCWMFSLEKERFAAIQCAFMIYCTLILSWLYITTIYNILITVHSLFTWIHILIHTVSVSLYQLDHIVVTWHQINIILAALAIVWCLSALFNFI